MKAKKLCTAMTLTTTTLGKISCKLTRTFEISFSRELFIVDAVKT